MGLWKRDLTSLCNAETPGGRWSALRVTRSGWSLVGASFVELMVVVVVVVRSSIVADRMMGRFWQELSLANVLEARVAGMF